MESDFDAQRVIFEADAFFSLQRIDGVPHSEANFSMIQARAILGEILVSECELRNILRQAQLKSDNPEQVQLVSRILVSVADICMELENLITELGGDPTNLSVTRPTIDTSTSLKQLLEAAGPIQRNIMARLDEVMARPAVRTHAARLLAIRQFHVANILWLADALGLNGDGKKH